MALAICVANIPLAKRMSRMGIEGRKDIGPSQRTALRAAKVIKAAERTLTSIPRTTMSRSGCSAPMSNSAPTHKTAVASVCTAVSQANDCAARATSDGRPVANVTAPHSAHHRVSSVADSTPSSALKPSVPASHPEPSATAAPNSNAITQKTTK